MQRLSNTHCANFGHQLLTACSNNRWRNKSNKTQVQSKHKGTYLLVEGWHCCCMQFTQHCEVPIFFFYVGLNHSQSIHWAVGAVPVVWLEQNLCWHGDKCDLMWRFFSTARLSASLLKEGSNAVTWRLSEQFNQFVSLKRCWNQDWVQAKHSWPCDLSEDPSRQVQC